MALTQIATEPIIMAFFLALAGCLLYTLVYRLYLTPIANFPGPKLAAVSFWYECYYDIFKGGRYSWKIAELHDKYGPIIRINPRELHVIDRDFYDVLYTGYMQKRDKWAWSAKVFTNPGSVFSTVPHDLHRLRRASLNPFFSKRSVSSFAGTIQETTERLCIRIREHMVLGTPVHMTRAWSSLTTDVITDYAFGKSFNCVTKPEFAPDWYAMINTPSKLSPIVLHFGWLLILVVNMPVWFAKLTSEPMHRLLLLEQGHKQQVMEIKAMRPEELEKFSQRTIFHELLKSDLPPQEKSVQRLVDEAKTLIGAGVITTAHTLETLTYYLLTNVDKLTTLKAELRSMMPKATQPVSLQKLEQLPYLTAVIKEGLRLSFGVSHRTQRIAPDTAMVYKDWLIPAGTPVGMTNMLTHLDAEIFPEPHAFRPERWLDPSHSLDKYLVVFGRGSRACIGMNLAWAELYIPLATVLRRFDFELYETTYADIETVHDYFTPYPKHDSNGVRVKVVGMDA